MTVEDQRWVYILAEVAKRELDSRALIAIELAKKGINVVFGEKDQILWNCCLGIYPPGVIFDKCAQIVENRKWQILKRRGFVFTSLDEEGLVTQPDYFFAERFSQKAEEESTITFCWGKKQADMIRSKYPQAQLVISGNPRMSLLHRKYHNWFQEEREEIKMKYGDFILVCSSFNPFEEAYDESNAWRRKKDQESKEKVLQLCNRLSDSGKKIVYRPHPSDAPTKLVDMEVDGRWSIAPWVQSCSLLLNANCGTSFDAYVANSPCLTLPNSSREYSFRFANAFARKIKGKGLDELNEIKPLRKSMLDRIASYNVANLDSPEKPIEIIARKLEELSFSNSNGIKSFGVSLYRLFILRNRIRFFLSKDDYMRIENKFGRSELSRIKRKFFHEGFNFSQSNKILVINGHS